MQYHRDSAEPRDQHNILTVLLFLVIGGAIFGAGWVLGAADSYQLGYRRAAEIHQASVDAILREQTQERRRREEQQRLEQEQEQK
jgi:hypothetical protein